MSRHTSMARGRAVELAALAGVASVAGVQLALAPGVGAASAPTLSVAPQGNYRDAQTITVSVGANGYFSPHARVNVIECADPGGSTANLPRDITTCDGNTIQGDSVLVAGDGSFTVKGYPVYALPSATLGEQANFQPVCDQTHYCVLYVGQNQNDFTAPKIFSAAFLVKPGTGSATTSPQASGPSATATGSTAASSTSGAVNPSATLAGATSLANTGTPGRLVWVAGAALVLLATGTVGRRVALRRSR